jgi:hypothetical protein
MSTGSSQQSETTQNDANRRFWFDYLGRLNDRGIQRTKESGVTNWVLLGALAAVVYQGVPQLPRLIAFPDFKTSTFVALLLEADVVMNFGFALAFAAYFSIGGVDKRLITDSARRTRQINLCASGILGLALSFGHFVAAYRFKGPGTVRWTLLSFGVWWTANIIVGIVQAVRTARLARKHRIRIPYFEGSILDPKVGSLTAFLLFSTLGIVPIVASYSLLRFLAQSAPGSVVILSTATQTLVCIAICLILFNRFIQLAPRVAYEALERAIVVENLTPSEIKSRFITQLLGADVKDWLQEIRGEVENSSAKLISSVNLITQQTEEIQAIDSQYVLERRGRAQKLLEQLEIAVGERKAVLGQFQFKLSEYSKLYIPASERSILKELLAELRGEWLETEKESVARTTALNAKLTALTQKLVWGG